MKPRSYISRGNNPYQLVQAYSLFHGVIVYMFLVDGKLCRFSGGEGLSSTIAALDISTIVDVFEEKEVVFTDFDEEQHCDIRVLYEFNTREDILTFKSKYPEYFI
ncbi:hypothetical protein [Vibrio phage phiKT1024]|nr:hypothetical protein [Vibrio phage phiKT1024]